MSLYTRLEVLDRDGWRKEFQLRKNIILIGSDPKNDIVLARAGSGDVALQHAQLICSPEGYRLVNLSSTEILLGPSGDTPLAPHALAEVADGEQIKIGDFTLILGGSRGRPCAAVDASTSDAIGLRLSLSETTLDPNHPLDGFVVVRNMGDKPGAQFKLEVENWEPETYDIGPGPILYPNAEKEVFFRLHHPRKPRPLAGKHLFSIRATAPQAYPGQSAMVSQEIDILPFYNHTLHLVILD